MYIFSFICVLLTPAAMFLVGVLWRTHPPKFGAGGLAYRTALTTRSQDTWDFAHLQISKLWIRLGILLSVVSAVLMVILRASYQSFVLWIIGGEMVFLCISAFLVDTALKNGFDEKGKNIHD